MVNTLKKNLMKKSNDVLSKEVVEGLKWEPLLNSNKIEVSVRDGIVTLSGTVDNYNNKKQAEYTVKHISGVKSVIDNVEVLLAASSIINDAAIAVSVIKALKEKWAVPNHSVRVQYFRPCVNPA